MQSVAKFYSFCNICSINDLDLLLSSFFYIVQLKEMIIFFDISLWECNMKI